METAERVCRLCQNTYPLTLEFFHGDTAREPPFHLECKTCRNAQKRGKFLALAHEKQEQIRKALVLQALGAAIKNPQAPHTAEITERVCAHMGGVEGLAISVHEHFLNTEIGGPQRTNMLRIILDLIKANVSLGGAKKPLDYYSEEELESELNARVSQVAQRLLTSEEVLDADVVDSAEHVATSETT